MSKWKVEALIIENEAARVYHDLQLGFCLSQKKDEIHGFTNEAEMPVIASFQICIKIVNYEAVAHSIKVKIPNAEAADVINTELNKLKLALFCEDDIKKLEKEFACPEFGTTQLVFRALDRVDPFTLETKLAIAKLFYFGPYQRAETNKSVKLLEASVIHNDEESLKKFAPTEFQDYQPVQKFLKETFWDVPSLQASCIKKISAFWAFIPNKTDIELLPQELQEAILKPPQLN